MTMLDTPTYTLPIIAHAIDHTEAATGVLASRCGLTHPGRADLYDEQRAVALVCAGALGAATALRVNIAELPRMLDEHPEARWAVLANHPFDPDGLALYADDGSLPLRVLSFTLDLAYARTQLRCSALGWAL